MTGISLAIANKIFEKFGISSQKHEVAGYLARRKADSLHTPTLWEACQKSIETWFSILED